MNASTCYSSSIVYLIILHSVFILLNSSRPIATTSISDQKHSLQLFKSLKKENWNNHSRNKRTTSTCTFKCTDQDHPVKPVCGSDGITYPNRCELQKVAKCLGKNVIFEQDGECSSGELNCLQKRAEALKHNKDTGNQEFVPVCREDDGSYVEVQCHYGTGYCWCVNEDGRPVPKSAIKYGRPKCRNSEHERKRNRRGKYKKQKNQNPKSEKKQRRNNICVQADRSEFNKNVANLIISDYRDQHGRERARREMIEWKFDQMDTDRNGILKKREFGAFRRIVKRISRNKVCARHFWKYCDQRSDGRLTRSEWTQCLGLDTNIPFTAFMSLNSREDQHQRKSKKTSKEPPRPKGVSQSHLKSVGLKVNPTYLYLSEIIQNRWRDSSLRPPGDSPIEMLSLSSSSSSTLDCKSANEQAIESIKNGVRNAFVPECDSNGRYLPVQCYKDSEWCWCVDKYTGSHISGTSIQNGRPNCAAAIAPSPSSKSFNHFLQKDWKKCPAEEKEKFKIKLMEFLTHVMRQETKSTTKTTTTTISMYNNNEKNTQLSVLEQENVAKWHFNKMDQNKDQKLSRKELRPLRRNLSSRRELKRCGKRIQLHCDPDENQFIFESEWLTCVLKQQEDAVFHQLPKVDVKNRKGPNPLLWLKAD